MTYAFSKKSTQLFYDNVTTGAFSLASVAAASLVVLTVNANQSADTTPIPAPSGWAVGANPAGTLQSTAYIPLVGAFHKLSSAGGTESATVAGLPSGSYFEGTISEFTNAGSAAVDGTPLGNSTGTAANSGSTGSASNTTTSGLAIAMFGVAGPAGVTSLVPPTSPWNTIDTEPSDSSHVAYSSSYQILSSIGSVSAGASWGGLGEGWTSLLIIYKDAGGAVTVKKQLLLGVG